MIHVAVCEDESAQLQYTAQLMQRCAKQSAVSVTVDTYENAEQLLFHIEDGKTYDILLLDIQMGKMNGIELARKMRETDAHVKIIFLTGIKDYAIEGYEVGAIRYLLKPIKEEEFASLLQTIWKEIEQDKEDYYIFDGKEECCKVLFKDILYVEAQGHYTDIVTIQKVRRLKTAFSAIEKQMDHKGFFLLRRGLYVNLERVASIGRDDCIMDNGEKLPISKARYREFNQAFITYYKK